MITSLFLAATLAASPAAPHADISMPAPDIREAITQQPQIEPATDTEVLIGTQDQYARMTVPVTVEGQGPFQFMIDTGSQATVVTRGLSDQLNLRPIGSAIVVGMASQVSVQLMELNGLEFAARVFDNISAPVLEAHNIGADGILGLDSLQDMRVMIDFRNDTIAVDTAKQLGGNSGFEIIVRARRKLGRLIITDAVLDGVRTSVIIDTGAQSSVGNMALYKKLRGDDNTIVEATDVHGKILSGSLNVVRSLQIGGVQLQNASITFSDSPAFKAMGLAKRPALILGMGNLRLFDRVAIDFESRQVLFDLPRNTRVPRLINTRGRATRL